jgi:hypothetical protein
LSDSFDRNGPNAQGRFGFVVWLGCQIPMWMAVDGPPGSSAADQCILGWLIIRSLLRVIVRRAGDYFFL